MEYKLKKKSLDFKLDGKNSNIHVYLTLQSSPTDTMSHEKYSHQLEMGTSAILRIGPMTTLTFRELNLLYAKEPAESMART